MRIVTERSLIKSVLERWEMHHGGIIGKWGRGWLATHEYPLYGGKTPTQIRDELRLLDLDKATIEQVGNVIGDSSWTNQRCDECGTYASYGIIVGEHEHEDKHEDLDSTFLCMNCMGIVADRWCVLKELVEGGF